MSHKAFFCLNNILCFFRSLWHGILVVASFIQHIIFKLKQSDSRLKKVALKHCSLSRHVSRFGFMTNEPNYPEGFQSFIKDMKA